MFTDDLRVNRVRVDLDRTTDDVLQAGCIEHRSSAHDAGGGQAGHFRQYSGEYVDRIADDENNATSANKALTDAAIITALSRSRSSRDLPGRPPRPAAMTMTSASTMSSIGSDCVCQRRRPLAVLREL
jgi:hypothetical protein